MSNTRLGIMASKASRSSKSRGIAKAKPRSLSGSTKKGGCGCKK